MDTSSGDLPRSCTRSAELQKLKVLILSDTHETDDGSESNAAKFTFPAVDVVLHCGDMTEQGDVEGFRKVIRLLESIDAELKLVIAGNHDISLDEAFCARRGLRSTACEEARNVWTAASANIRLLEEGCYTFTLNRGASFRIFASPYSPQFGDSAFQYPPGHDRFNPTSSSHTWAQNAATSESTIPDGIDIAMTHGPPKYILDRCNDGRDSGGCHHLRRAIERTRPLLHAFGHIHSGREGNSGAQRGLWREGELHLLPPEFVGANACKRRGYASLSPGSADAVLSGGKQTLFINAAIMDRVNDPCNYPWVVELPARMSHPSYRTTA